MQMNQEQKNPTHLWEQREQFKDRGLLPSAQTPPPPASAAVAVPWCRGTEQRCSSKWKHRSPCRAVEKLKQSWPVDPLVVSKEQLKLGALKWPLTVLSFFYQHTTEKKPETTHSGSSTCLRTSDAPAPGKGKSRIRIHSGHVAVTHHMHSYLQKKKKIDKST